MGFEVENSDLTAAPGDNLEDLIVCDPGHPGWVALVEVKGYTKGAQTAALTQCARFSSRYALKHRREPDALWYIVNQFLTKDPEDRQPVLHGNDQDVEAFAEADGLIMDTIELFRSLMRLRRGELTGVQVRAALHTTGIYLTPPAGWTG